MFKSWKTHVVISHLPKPNYTELKVQLYTRKNKNFYNKKINTGKQNLQKIAPYTYNVLCPCILSKCFSCIITLLDEDLIKRRNRCNVYLKSRLFLHLKSDFCLKFGQCFSKTQNIVFATFSQNDFKMTIVYKLNNTIAFLSNQKKIIPKSQSDKEKFTFCNPNHE